MTPNDKLVSLNDLGNILGGLSRATIYRHMKNIEGFPVPIKIGSATRFRESDVQAFIAAQSKRGEVEN